MSDSITPPRFATLLLSLFVSEVDFPQIEGDLSEEFHSCLLASGPKVARRWYWREALRNMWALAKRPSTIQVLAVAVLAVFVFPLFVTPLFHWLDTFFIVSVTAGLQLFLVAVFEVTIALLMGVLMSRFLSGRERLLRMAFTGFFGVINVGLYLYFIWSHGLNMRVSYFSLNVVNWSLILIAFWKGSVWMGQHKTRRIAG